MISSSQSDSTQNNRNHRTAHITSLDAKGRGVGITDTGGIITVPFTIPGERVEVEKLKRKQGKILRFIDTSEFRIESRCRHFGACGGCSWQHIRYEKQLQLKRLRIWMKLRDYDIHVPFDEITIEPSSPFSYRSRMDFIWWHDGRFGLREAGKWYSIVNLNECHLLSDYCMNIAFTINRRAHDLNLPFRDAKHKIPGLRYLILRRGVFTNEIMLLLVSDRMEIPETLWSGFDSVTSVYQLINDQFENDLSDGKPRHLWGNQTYRESIQGHLFEIGPRSFFQPNPLVAEKMVEYVRRLVLEIPEKHSVVDLYCGIGLFAISLSDQFDEIVGIENNAEAIDLARKNTISSNSMFHVSDAEQWIASCDCRHDFLLVDPPRTGLPTSVVSLLADRPFNHFIYVSCNPNRGIEDIATLSTAYRLVSIRLFDQFPQTPHVEMIAYLTR